MNATCVRCNRDTFIDVGADFGWYTVIGAKAVGPSGRVIAFETGASELGVP